MWHLETIEKFNIIKEVNMMTVCKNRNLLAGGLMLLSLMLFSGAAVAVPQFGKCYSLSYGTWNGQKWGHLELSPAWKVDVLSRRVPPYFNCKYMAIPVFGCDGQAVVIDVMNGALTPDDTVSVRLIEDWEMLDILGGAESESSFYSWPSGLWSGASANPSRKWVLVQATNDEAWSGAPLFMLGIRGTSSITPPIAIVRYVHVFDPKETFGINIQGLVGGVESSAFGICSLEGYEFGSGNYSPQMRGLPMGYDFAFDFLEHEKLPLAVRFKVPKAGKLVVRFSAGSYDVDIRTLNVSGTAYRSKAYADYEDWSERYATMVVTASSAGNVDISGFEDYLSVDNVAFYPTGEKSVAVVADYAGLERCFGQEEDAPLEADRRDYVSILPCLVTGTKTYTVGEKATLTCLPGTGEEFDHWEFVDCETPPDATTCDATLSFTVPSLEDDYPELHVRPVLKPMKTVILGTMPVGVGSVDGGRGRMSITADVYVRAIYTGDIQFRGWHTYSPIDASLQRVSWDKNAILSSSDLVNIYLAVYPQTTWTYVTEWNGDALIGDGKSPARDDLKGRVEIPSKIDDCPVVGLRDKSFYECGNMTEVVIPEGVTWIGNYAFYGCSNLTSITLPQTLEHIGDYAFYGCAVEKVVIPESVTWIGDLSFYGCSRLTSLTLPQTLDDDGIGDSVFAGCSISEIELPQNWQTIKDGMFMRCSKLQQINFPTSVTSIGSCAFSGCSSLREIVLPPKLKAVGSSAFSECSLLEVVDIPQGVLRIGNGAFQYCDNLREVSIPNGVEKICGATFYYCSKLREISIPSSVEFVEDRAFSCCDSLQKISFSDWLGYEGRIKSGAFEGCSNVVKVCVLPAPKKISESYADRYQHQGMEKILPDSFRRITDVVFEDGCVCVYDNMFSSCENLKNVVLSSTVEEIRYGAFGGCSGLSEIRIPPSVTNIGLLAFASCKSLSSIALQDGLRTIGQLAFSGCDNLRSITIPASVTDIGSSAFNSCKSLLSVSLHEGLRSIGSSAFGGCPNLRLINIPKSVLHIGSTAFWGCSALEPEEGLVIKDDCVLALNGKCPADLVIPEGVRLITGGVFSGTDVETVTLSASLTSIGEGAFSGCWRLTEIVLPEGLTILDPRAFANCTRLERITCGGRLDVIPADCFRNCSQLKDIKLPERLKRIEEYAFYGCRDLMSISLPNTIEFVGYGAFMDCYPRESMGPDGVVASGGCILTADKYNISFYTNHVDVPESIRHISGGAFSNCIRLVSIRISGNVELIDRGTFANCPNLKTVELGEGIASIGSQSFLNCQNLEKIVIPHSVTNIDDYAFRDCKNLRQVDILNPNAIVSRVAFYGCTQIKSVTLPEMIVNDPYLKPRDFFRSGGITNVVIADGVKHIGSNAFYGWGLSRLSIPESVISIGSGAFKNCQDLGQGVIIADGCVLTVNPVHTPDWTLLPMDGDVILPEGTRLIADGAFQGCTNLTSITIPDSVVVVGAYAFSGCESLEGIVIPNGVQKIGKDTFYGCFSLSKISLPESISEIGVSALACCSGLTELTIPNSVRKIGKRAFTRCWRLKQLELPDSIEHIGDSAFSDCYGLKQVVLPEALKEISDGMFYDCLSLEYCRIPESIGRIGAYAFSGSSGNACRVLNNVLIPSSVTNIAEYAFSGCASLKRMYVDYGDTKHVQEMLAESKFDDFADVEFVEREYSVLPTVVGDASAEVTGDANAGFVVRPSAGTATVVVEIPDGIDAAKVRVEVSPDVKTVTPNGAAVRVVRGDADITDFLDIPAAVDGVVDLGAATVKPEFANEPLDPSKDAKVNLSVPDAPSLTTAPTRRGLVYQLKEGATLEAMEADADGDQTVGDGQPWTPNVTVKGGASGFYSIRVSK